MTVIDQTRLETDITKRNAGAVLRVLEDRSLNAQESLDALVMALAAMLASCTATGQDFDWLDVEEAVRMTYNRAIRRIQQ